MANVPSAQPGVNSVTSQMEMRKDELTEATGNGKPDPDVLQRREANASGLLQRS